MRIIIIVLKQRRTGKKHLHTEKKKSGYVVFVGYVYDGDDFENEPDDYVCPVCGAKKEMFKLQ